MMYTITASKADTDLFKLELAQSLKKIIDSLQKKKAFLSFNKKIISVSYSDILMLMANIECEGPNRVLLDIVSSNISSCEKQAPTSSLFFLYALYFLLKDSRKENINQKYYDDIASDIIGISRLSKRCTSTNIFEFLENLVGDIDLVDMAKEAIELAGPEGQLNISPYYAEENIVELTVGFRYNIRPPAEFYSMTRIKMWDNINVKCIIIDGIIEKVSEIHKILEYSFDTKQPIAIVSRGYSEEVIATISTNYNMKKINILPLLVPYDLGGINSLKDIATICGTDVVSSLKGELISTIRIDQLVTVDKIKLENGAVSLSSTNNIAGVKRLRNDLNERILMETIPDKKNLLTKRVNCLSDTCVTISLSKSLGEYRGTTIDRLQTCIRAFKDMCINGNINLEDVDYDNVSSPIFKIIMLSHINKFRVVSARALIHGIVKALSVIRVLDNCNTMVLVDNE